jgi:hypothetical protein
MDATGAGSAAWVVQGSASLVDRQLDQVMDEIETITVDLDALLAQVRTSGAP